MDTLVATVAIAAWLLLMIPAAFVFLVGTGDVESEGRTAPPALAIVLEAGGILADVVPDLGQQSAA